MTTFAPAFRVVDRVNGAPAIRHRDGVRNPRLTVRRARRLARRLNRHPFLRGTDRFQVEPWAPERAS